MRTPDIDLRVINTGINKIINGGFDFWQRGTSFSETSGATDYYADRFGITRDFVSGTLNIDRSTDIPSELINDVSYSLKLTGSSLNVNWLAVRQLFETNFSKIINKKNGNVFVSFWVKSSKTGTFSAHLRNVADTVNVDAIYYKTLTIDSANTWERKTFAIPATTLALVQGADNAANWELGITIKAQTTSPVEGWQRFDSSASGTDDFNFTANDEFWTTGWMLHDASHGEVDFQRAGRNYQEEEQLCERYYERITGTSFALPCRTIGGGTLNFAVYRYKIRKRVSATFSASADSTFRVIALGSSSLVASVLQSQTYEDFFELRVTSSVNFGTNVVTTFNSISIDAFLAFDAEL